MLVNFLADLASGDLTSWGLMIIVASAVTWAYLTLMALKKEQKKQSEEHKEQMERQREEQREQMERQREEQREQREEQNQKLDRMFNLIEKLRGDMTAGFNAQTAATEKLRDDMTAGFSAQTAATEKLRGDMTAGFNAQTAATEKLRDYMTSKLDKTNVDIMDMHKGHLRLESKVDRIGGGMAGSSDRDIESEPGDDEDVNGSGGDPNWDESGDGGSGSGGVIGDEPGGGGAIAASPPPGNDARS